MVCAREKKCMAGKTEVCPAKVLVAGHIYCICILEHNAWGKLSVSIIWDGQAWPQPGTHGPPMLGVGPPATLAVSTKRNGGYSPLASLEDVRAPIDRLNWLFQYLMKLCSANWRLKHRGGAEMDSTPGLLPIIGNHDATVECVMGPLCRPGRRRQPRARSGSHPHPR